MNERLRFYALWICAICIVVFLLQVIVSGFTEMFLLNSQAFYQPWRFVTAIFLHGDISHLLFNLLALALFGSVLERMIGSRRFLLVFFVTGILANLISVFFYNASLGASGAIFGVIGVLILLNPKLKVWIYFMPLPIWAAGIVWVIGDLIGIFVPNGIANLAHLSGIAFGIVFGIIFRKYRAVYPSNKGRIKVTIDEDYMRRWEDKHLR